MSKRIFQVNKTKTAVIDHSINNCANKATD